LTNAEARDAAERASRDQARTALQLRAAAAKKAAAEAPRFVLPIAYHTGLSALFGQAGTHWMQLHTGIDFPVPEGTPVHAVTAGSVNTEWNPFYGYMSKVTAPDGTVTWYCHLSAYRVRSGPVRVGDVIAYSGDSGNSTGPHLHFEVHPDGGPAVDPLPWLLTRGLDPR
jgi:murein DD-endopeptidase MepM/ murein hydrolase activator NlpD